MHDRAEVSPVGPVAADVLRGRARDPIKPIGDIAERRGLDLDPLLYLLLEVIGVKVPAGLVLEEGERVEERRSTRRRDRSIGDPREKPLDLGVESGLLRRLAAERIEDPFAVVNASG